MNLFRRRKKTASTEQREDAKRAQRSDDLGNAALEEDSKEGHLMSQPNAPTSDDATTGTGVADAIRPEAQAEPGAASADETPTSGAPRPAPGARTPAELREDVIAVLKTVYDPEIPVDIYELGLIYEVDVEPTGDIEIVMTLTTPMCPVAETLPPEVEAKVRDVPGVGHVQLELVWEPPWSMDMMSESARLELNL